MADFDLRAVAFPKLSERQLVTLGECAGAVPALYQDGEALFRVGDRDFKFYVVKSGSIDIVDESGDAPRVVVTHEVGSFTGDVSHLTGSPAVVSAIARGDCQVFEISTDSLREVVNRCTEFGDIILQAFLARRQLLREPGNFTGFRLIGSRYSKDTYRIRDFLAKNRVLFTWLDLEADADVHRFLAELGLTEADTPVVACARMMIRRNPSNQELAEELGIRKPLDHRTYDLVVVGAGPAGLAAAVYGASEGLATLILERTAPGGQAGSSMRIENYLGFPTGITGGELTDRAVLQASKFGAVMSVATPITQLSFDQKFSILTIDGGETVVSKCLLIATGADYRRLSVEGCAEFEGCGVYYAATPNEAQICRDAEVIVVGGGNSAGQAAVFLASQAKRVYLVVRGDNLHANMSSYLAHRIEQTEDIEILLNTTINRMSGEGQLAQVELLNSVTGESRTVATPAVFSFIGAVPRTTWLPSEIVTDDRGFVRTGVSVSNTNAWGGRRPPFLLETSRPGVFCAGDVRAGSVKRVASAVGEGAMAVQFVHEVLKEM
jgi:thioredoxin reductase (NADPH)